MISRNDALLLNIMTNTEIFSEFSGKTNATIN